MPFIAPTFVIADAAGGGAVGSILTNAGAPVNGVAGTGTYAGFAGKGVLLIDVTNGTLYQNTGTLLSPVWTAR